MWNKGIARSFSLALFLIIFLALTLCALMQIQGEQKLPNEIRYKKHLYKRGAGDLIFPSSPTLEFVYSGDKYKRFPIFLKRGARNTPNRIYLKSSRTTMLFSKIRGFVEYQRQKP